MIIPTATACMDISCGIPNSEHAIGMSNSEPPATPEAPHAPRVAIRLSMSAVGTSTDTPMVFATESAIIVIVMAAPSILMVAPSGMDTEYTSGSSPSLLQSDMFTGIFAAELLVKNAVTPDSLRHLHASGYAFLLKTIVARSGSTINATVSMAPTSTSSNLPYSLNIDNPLSDTVVNTSPMIPNGAHPMIHLTTVDTASDMDTSADFIDLLVRRMASPNKSAHASMQR